MIELEKKLQYTFQNPSLLRLALTHPSTNRPNNQRLEFLGDAVLEFCVSDMLYHKYPLWQEGKLTARRAALVCEKALALIGRNLNLGQYLDMSLSEAQTGGRNKDSILCDTVEAVLAAVYMDGGVEEVYRIVLRLFADEERLISIHGDNYKGELQNAAQALGMPVPVYTIINRTGTDNAPIFTVKVELKNGIAAVGQGGSKLKAQQQAAQMALKQLHDKGGKQK